jgi:hypothetical protein
MILTFDDLYYVYLQTAKTRPMSKKTFRADYDAWCATEGRCSRTCFDTNGRAYLAAIWTK